MERTAPSAPSAAVPAEALNQNVRQETVQTTICVPGCTASVRPSTDWQGAFRTGLGHDATGCPATLLAKGLPANGFWPATLTAEGYSPPFPLAGRGGKGDRRRL